MRDQLHGDGQGDRGAPVLPADQGPADQGHFAASQEGHGAGPGHPDNVTSGIEPVVVENSGFCVFEDVLRNAFVV